MRNELFLRELLIIYNIVLVQEHWLLPSSLNYLDTLSEKHYVHSKSSMTNVTEKGMLRGRPHGGLAIFYPRYLAGQIVKVNTNNDRIIALKVNIDPVPFIVLGIYMPCDKSYDAETLSEVDDILGEIEFLYMTHQNCEFLLAGDFNCDFRRNTPHVRRIRQFIVELSFSHKSENVDVTYRHDGLNHVSCIDHVFASGRIANNIHAIKHVESGSNLSCHLPVSWSVSCVGDAVDDQTRSMPSVKKKVYVWAQIDAEEYRNDVKHRLAHIHRVDDLMRGCEPNCTNVEHKERISECYQSIVRCLHAAGVKSVPQRPVGSSKHWWNDDIQSKKRASIEAHAMWENFGKPRSGPVNDHRLHAKYVYKNAIRNAKLREDSELNDNLADKLLEKRGKCFWKMWKNNFSVRSKPTDVLDGVNGPINVAEKHKEKFEKIFKPNNPERNAELEHIFNSEYDTYDDGTATENFLASFYDVVNAIKCLGSGKSCGPDGIYAEHLLHAPRDLVIHVTILFNLMLIHGFVPDDFGVGLIVPLIKDERGDKTDSGNYRGITLSPIISKVYEQLLKQKFELYLQTTCNMVLKKTVAVTMPFLRLETP